MVYTGLQNFNETQTSNNHKKKKEKCHEFKFIQFRKYCLSDFGGLHSNLAKYGDRF